jgi:hypothetical protein
MWNFFISFFYEACLEVAMSIIIGLYYIEDYDSEPDNKQFNTVNKRNTSTRQVHRILVYSFTAMQAIAFLAVIYIMTRKVERLE